VVLQGTSIPLVARWLGVDGGAQWPVKAGPLPEDERVAL
jgi:hypothetical protein